MRCALVLVAWIGVVLSPGFLAAQVESPEAREIRQQLEALQNRLADLTRQDSSGRNITEIGSSRGRSVQEDKPRLVVRIYDLSDLFSIAPRYAAHEPTDLQPSGRPIFPDVEQSVATRSGSFGGGGMGGAMGGGMFSVPSTVASPQGTTTLHQGSGAMGGTVAESSQSSVERLIATITQTISPQDWDSVGGPASITSLGASMIVSAPLDVHDKIAALLDLFRKRWGSLRTVALQAHWLWLSEDQLAAGLAQAAPPIEGKPAAFGAVNGAGWKQLREAAAANAAAPNKTRRGYHATLTCYNGQTVYAVAGGQQLVVAGVTPVVGGGVGGPAYHPNVQAVQEGAALQITPIATRTAKFVVADVHSRVNLLSGPADRLGGVQKDGPMGEAVQVAAAIDRPVLQSQRLSTTLRVPVDHPTLVGGMSFQTPGGEANLYLFLTARVQELRDDEGAELKPEAAPAAEPKPPTGDPAAAKP